MWRRYGSWKQQAQARVLRATREGGPVGTLTCEPGAEALAGRALGSAGPGSLGLAPRV